MAAASARAAACDAGGFLVSTSPDGFTERLRKFSQGLKEQGFVEGENVAIVYRFADNQADRLPELAADLVRRKVAVIATGGPPATFAAQATTATIPITFLVADDPVRLGLAASLSRPSSNMTGINVFNAEVAPAWTRLKRMPRMPRSFMRLSSASLTLVSTTATPRAVAPICPMASRVTPLSVPDEYGKKCPAGSWSCPRHKSGPTSSKP